MKLFLSTFILIPFLLKGQKEESRLIYFDSYGSKISIKYELIPKELDTTFFKNKFNSFCQGNGIIDSTKQLSMEVWEIKRIRKRKKYRIKFMIVISTPYNGIEHYLKNIGIQNWEIKLRKNKRGLLEIESCKYLYAEI